MRLAYTNLTPRFPFILQFTFHLFCMNLLFFPFMVSVNGSGNQTDRFALLKFKEQITNDPNGILNSWNDSLHFCQWTGVTCGRHHRDRVTSLVLERRQLVGTISQHIGNLSFLSKISLSNNNFRGTIPEEIGNLFRLQFLGITNNSLEGEIPANLTHCSQIRSLLFGGNHLIGRIPAKLGSLTMLKKIELRSNYLTGEIPHFLANLSKLTSFDVTYNHLVGSIPDSMGLLRSLKNFSIAVNNISGTIPPSLLNLSSISVIAIAANKICGSLPENIGFTLPNLRFLLIGGNNFSGFIPNSLANASLLEEIDLGDNNFRGQVSTNLGDLKRLWRLRLEINYLGKNSKSDLTFISSLKNCTNLKALFIGNNFFGGALPSSVANLSVELKFLELESNQIYGPIPLGLQNLKNLISLNVGYNFLTGSIPSYFFGKFEKLQRLDFGWNKLTGQISSSIGSLNQLYFLSASNNRLEGSIPQSIGNCHQLTFLDFSSNNLSGPIPHEIFGLPSLIELYLSQNLLSGNITEEIGKLRKLEKLDVSENRLSGEIPSTLGDCLDLEDLSMQGNFFYGTIPSSVASIKGLQYVDFSRNNLKGEIPRDMQNLLYMSYLNLSFNDLEGEVPTRGVFGNVSAVFLVGNIKLCGGIPKLHLKECPIKPTKSRKADVLKPIYIIIPSLLFVLLVSSVLIFSCIRKSKMTLLSENFAIKSLVNVSYGRLYKATEEFSPSNLIGRGSFGSVYKGSLDEVEKPIVVKVLNLEQEGASKSIMAECNALRNIRHRNLVKLIAYCSSQDHNGNEFKALVFELMENGNLDKWLHPANDDGNQQCNLTLLQRINIAIDVASAVHYLHGLCDNVIIHCDLKPSNVLLDDDMVAHVSDFGLAKLFSAPEDPQSTVSSIGIKGTIGYAAPEYAIGAIPSKAGDVYSYGIILLEMFSGKRPTNQMFKDGFNIHEFVKAALPGRLMQIVDPTLLNRGTQRTGSTTIIAATRDLISCENVEEETNTNLDMDAEKCLLSIFEIGVACSFESPEQRMQMADVTRKLHSIKDGFLRSQIRQGRPCTRPLVIGNPYLCST